GLERARLSLPLGPKAVSARTRNSAHGSPTRIPAYLAKVYRETLGGNTGRRSKLLGRAQNDADTFYHVLTRTAYGRKTINERTFRRILTEFVVGYERLGRVRGAADRL